MVKFLVPFEILRDSFSTRAEISSMNHHLQQ